MGLRTIAEAVLRPFGLRVIRAHQADPIYIHSYKGGYEEYRRLQIFHNKRKLTHVWADETTLDAVRAHLTSGGRKVENGICHGARNGFEVAWFRKALGADVMGSDISDSATEFDNMVVWDFQDENPDWADKFDFVYTNSLDQAMEPDRALAAWAKQLKPGGRIYIEHTMAHSPEGASEMDPFGAHPMCMPYLFFTWGRGKYVLADIVELESKANLDKRVWIFVLERA